jgi:hypothetical protein
MMKKTLFAALMALLMVGSFSLVAEAAPRKAVHHRGRRVSHTATSTTHSTIRKSAGKKSATHSRRPLRKSGRHTPTTKPR